MKNKEISERTKAGLAATKARGTILGNPRPAEALSRASKAIQARKLNFAVETLKVIQEIKGTGANSLSKIADCLNKRGQKTPRNGSWTATAVKRVLAVELKT